MYKQISDYLARDIYPFHTPGHKRNPLFLPPGLLSLDITEIPGMDALSRPTGILRELRELIAEIYGSASSYLLVNGSSAGVIAAICACCAEDGALVVPRNAHVSAYYGLAFSGVRPCYILPEITYDGLAGGIPPEAFNSMPYGAAALVVSPTYEGFVSDIAAIAEKVHARGGVLIVDEAHGAHFAFHGSFPRSAAVLGADIVINSLHKTLPALSQCAVLHVIDKRRVDEARVNFYINSAQTSSPSYILMAACDFMLRELREKPELFDGYVTRLDEARAFLSGFSYAALRLSGRERVGENAVYALDPGKLLFTLHTPRDAQSIAEAMADEYKTQPEMARGRHILAMTSVADTDEGFARLKNAVTGLNAKLPVSEADAINSEQLKLPEVVLSPREALKQKSELVPREKAAGRISGEIITAYPPGIALAAPGERIPEGLRIETPFVRVLD